MGIQSFLEKKAKGSIWQLFIKEHWKSSFVTFLRFSLESLTKCWLKWLVFDTFVKKKELKENEISF